MCVCVCVCVDYVYIDISIFFNDVITQKLRKVLQLERRK